VADITTAAGVPKGSFYQYFDSKQSYAIELLDDYWSAVEEKHTKVLLDDRYAPLDRIARHFHSIGQDHKQQKYALGCLIGNLGVEIAGAGEDAQSKLRQIIKRWATLLSDCLSKRRRPAISIAKQTLKNWLLRSLNRGKAPSCDRKSNEAEPLSNDLRRLFCRVCSPDPPVSDVKS